MEVLTRPSRSPPQAPPKRRKPRAEPNQPADPPAEDPPPNPPGTATGKPKHRPKKKVAKDSIPSPGATAPAKKKPKPSRKAIKKKAMLQARPQMSAKLSAESAPTPAGPLTGKSAASTRTVPKKKKKKKALSQGPAELSTGPGPVSMESLVGQNVASTIKALKKKKKPKTEPLPQTCSRVPVGLSVESAPIPAEPLTGRNDVSTSTAPEKKTSSKVPSQVPAELSAESDPILAEPMAGRNVASTSKAPKWKSESVASGRAPAKFPAASKTRSQVFFDEYWPLSRVEKAMAKKTVFWGTIRINKKNPTDAYVTCDEMEKDIYIMGKQRRNRAFDGDTVCVKLIKSDQILKLQQKIRDQTRQRMNARIAKRSNQVETDCVEADPVIADASELATEEGTGGVASNPTDSEPARLCGAVVYVPPSKTLRTASGVLKRFFPEGSSKAGPPTRVFLKPNDPRLPLIQIPREWWSSDFNPGKQFRNNVIYKVVIKDWPIYNQEPRGIVSQELGESGTIVAETEALLADCCVDHRSFTNAVCRSLPQSPWSIPHSEFLSRRDLRKSCIFTIDPETARDLDDAVSWQPLSNGNFRVGVHIADVSYFVPPDTALDDEARGRATTVYLVQKAIPMLPSQLCEELCSLNPGVDRLAFSVIWEMTPKAQIVSTWFGRTIIHSCAKISYERAQDVIEGKPLDASVLVTQFPRYFVETGIKNLLRLSKILRENRVANGALTVNSIRLHFELDEAGDPIACRTYDYKDSNRLIEEFMLLANMSVAKRISEAFPNHALLRCHPPPLPRELTRFEEMVSKLGYDFKTTSSLEFQQSFNRVSNPQDRMLLQLLAVRPMCRAKYFCTGFADPAEFHHYALSVPLYTHFTSPIRRYADVIVHRLLAAAIQDESPRFNIPPEVVRNIAQTCNTKKGWARMAQDQSSLLYLALYLDRIIKRQAGDPFKCSAMVLDMNPTYMDLVVLEYGIEKRIYWDRLPIRRCTYFAGQNLATLEWNPSPSHGRTTKPTSRNPPLDAAASLSAELDKLTLDAAKDTPTGPTTSYTQTVQSFKPVAVLITTETNRSPPVINVELASPFA